MRRAAFVAFFVILAGSDCATAQLPGVSGYYLTVPSWTDSTPMTVGGLSSINRFRLMAEPTLNDFTLQVAYEQTLNLSQRIGAYQSGIVVSANSAGGEWLPLQWTIEEQDHVTWAHRFDRLKLSWAPSDKIEMAVGRQTISWATTLFLTPADPFLPFDPSDPFREYRAGVDAFRLQYFAGPFSDIDFVVRQAEFSTGTKLSVLARGRTVWRSWEVSTWLGMLYGELAAAIGAAGGVGPVAVRGEVTLQENDGEMALRGTVGIDGRFGIWDRDLLYVFEYQRDGFGARRSSDLAQAVHNDAFARGQLQVLGRDELVAQGSYQLHPLWSLQLLVLTNLNDPTALLSPAASYSVSDEVSASGGMFFGLGNDTPSLESAIPSEYGLVPNFFYLSLTLFF